MQIQGQLIGVLLALLFVSFGLNTWNFSRINSVSDQRYAALETQLRTLTKLVETAMADRGNEAQKPAASVQELKCPEIQATQKDKSERRDKSEPDGDCPQAMLELPHGTVEVLLNVGTNTDPLRCPQGKRGCHAIGFEPKVSYYPDYPKDSVAAQLNMVTAAVSSCPGLATFHETPSSGGSSSLAAPKDKGLKLGFTSVSYVPVITLRTVINSIPASVDLPYLLCDAQGHDVNVIKSAGDSLKRIKKIVMEVDVMKHGRAYYDIGDTNKQEHADAYMSKMGYRKVGWSCNGFDYITEKMHYQNEHSECEEANITYERID